MGVENQIENQFQTMVQNPTTFETSFDKSDHNNLINNNNLNYPVVSNSSADPYFHLIKTQFNHISNAVKHRNPL